MTCLNLTYTASYAARLCQHQSQTLPETKLAELYFNFFIINAAVSHVLSMRYTYSIESRMLAKQIAYAGITRLHCF